MERTIVRGISGALFVFSVAPAVAAQTTQPAGAASVVPGPPPQGSPTAASSAQPSMSQTQPDTAPPAGAASQAPSTLPAPPTSPQPTYPPPGYGQPPPQYYWAPQPYAAQAPSADAAAEATQQGPKRGFYGGAWVGVGGPFGGDTTTGPGFGYKDGIGALGALGWAFIPNFGVDLFFHYNHTALALDESDQDDFSTNSAYGLFYGLEARGIAGSGPFVGWASLGISLGTGTLTLESSRPGLSGGPNQDTGKVTLKPMPVLAFGAEFEVAKGLGLGPQVRWYIVNVDSACLEGTRQRTTFDPFTGQPTGTETVTTSDCASHLSEVNVPDILFLGLGLTYRIGT